ncbi:MAG: hypothetical protein IT480_06455 [Gammaproteobacteria bacterium]|nr:hypothetical protein [Gammaproteobacteria bacterium]
MSLLFLGVVSDPFQALDDAGRPLPGAILTFWESGTTTPAVVYEDQNLATALSDTRGRVVGDSEGLFPYIFLDPQVSYRVRLETAQGVLRWDVDPYLCDCTDPPLVFHNPVHQALTREEGDYPVYLAPPKSGARLRFTLTLTDTPVDVYADAARKVALPNPLRSNAAGIFPPVYLGASTYRVRCYDATGALVFDVDPYECECGFLLLTSRPYPIEDRSALASSFAMNFGYTVTPGTEGMDSAFSALGGNLYGGLVNYDDAAPEGIDSAFSALGGNLYGGLVTYSNYPPEGMDSTFSALGGDLYGGLITYSNYPAEGMDSTLAPLASTLE